MPAQSTVFPAFIRAEFDGSGNGFAAFEQSAKASADRTRQHFESSFSEIQRIASSALSMPRNSGGSLDLNVGQYRDAATAANQHALALREVAVAAERAAMASRDESEATRLYVQAARAAALEAENNARATNQQAAAMERLQAELNRNQSATTKVIASQRPLNDSLVRGADGARAQRFAWVMLGQQMQDVAIQAQAGVNPFVILVQQGSQAAFAMTGFRGVLGRVAQFLSGPWGAAVFIGVAALGSFLTRTKETEDSLAKLVQSADSFGTAQTSLGKVMDLVTGKFENHNLVLRETIRLQATANIMKAREAKTEAEENIRGVGLGRSSGFLAPGERVTPERISQIAAEGRAMSGPVRGVFSRFMGGKTNISQARAELESLDKQGKLAGETLADLTEKMIKFGTASNDVQANQAIIDALDGKGLDPRLRRKGPKPKKPKDHSREIENLDEFGRDAADRIANLTAPFQDQPKRVEQAAKALRSLADIQDDIIRKNDRLIKLTGHGLPDFDKLIASAREAKGVIADGIFKPYDDFIDDQKNQFEIGKLLVQGREDEAQALQIIYNLQKQIGVLDPERKQAVLDTVEALRLQAREIDIIRKKQGAYLDTLADIRSNIQQTIEGIGDRGLKSIGDFVKGLKGTFNRLTSELITQKLFDPIFRDLEDMVLGRNPVQTAGEKMADAMAVGSSSVTSFANAVDAAVAQINGTVAAGGVGGLDTGALDAMIASNAKALKDGVTGAIAAANDNADEIVVTGQRKKPGFNQDPATFMSTTFGSLLEKIGGPLGKKIGDQVGTALQGAGIGQMAGGLILGSKSNNTGAAIGGAIGGVAGKELGGAVAGPVGAAVGKVLGSVLGGTLGGMIGGAKKGSSTIGVNADGQLVVASTTGNSKKFQKASGGAADSAITTIERIAEMLGGTITGTGSVSIGVRDGKYRVDPTGRGNTKVKKGAIDFGDDSTAAVRAATLDLIKDGMIGGLRASTQRLLQAAKDLDAGIEKALKFESVFTRLKEFTDPVGAAIDALDKEFTSLRAIFREAGASAAEYADLEKLYGLEREKAIKEAGSAMTSTLKSLLADLTVNNDARSLRERLAMAKATFDPLAADLAAGKNVDIEAFDEAARNILDIQRQLSGSQEGYFTLLDQITRLTEGALAKQQGLIDAAVAGGPKPGAPAANDNTVSAIDRLGDRLGGILNGQLGAVNSNLGRLIGGGRAGGAARDIIFTGINNF